MRLLDIFARFLQSVQPEGMESPSETAWSQRADDSCQFTHFERQEARAMQTELSSLVIGAVIFLASFISVEVSSTSLPGV